MEDQPADPGDLTTGAESSAQPTGVAETTPPRRRRWFSLRRSKTSETQQDAASEAVAEEPEQAPRTPVGKAARTAKSKAGTDEPAVAQESEAVEEPGAVTQEQEAAGETESDTVSDEPATDTTAEAPAAEVAQREVVFVAHRPVGKRLIAAVVAAGVLFVGAAAFAGATLQPYLANRAEVDTKLDVARTAASAISTLWTYTPDNMETLPDRASVFLGGDFAYEYRRYIDAIVATNKQAQVTNTTQVMGAAVETLTPSEATAIVYTNSVATSPMTKNIPSLRYLSYRLTMERRDAKWVITRMSTITSLDLTPQL